MRQIFRSLRGWVAWIRDRLATRRSEGTVEPMKLDAYKLERCLDGALLLFRRSYISRQASQVGLEIRDQHFTRTTQSTHWDYLRNTHVRNAGFSIDHLLLSPRSPTDTRCGHERGLADGWNPVIARQWITLAKVRTASERRDLLMVGNATRGISTTLTDLLQRGRGWSAWPTSSWEALFSSLASRKGSNAIQQRSKA